MDIAARLDFSGLTAGLPARAGARREKCKPGRKAGAQERIAMKLEPYRVALLHARGPVEVTCQSGQLWITRDGQPEDIVLQAGQSTILREPVRDVVLSTAGARCPATFGIQRPEAVAKHHWSFWATPLTYFQVEFA